MQVIIDGTDITNLVVEGTYKMDTEDTYESWLDGNMVEHRIIVTSKVSGEFDVVLSGKSGMTLSQFRTLLNTAADNGVINAAVYLTNTGTVKAIEAYFKLTSKQHVRIAGGSFLDVVKMEIQER